MPKAAVRLKYGGGLLSVIDDLLVEAAVATGVTRRADLHHFYKQSVVVAVRRDAHDFLRVPARRALVPKRLAAATVKPCVAGLQLLDHRLTVHRGQHQHFSGGGLLHNRGNQL